MSFFDEPSPAPSSHYICLLELDDNFLSDLSKDSFSKPQSLLLTESSVVWLTTGAYRSALHPERNMAQGMFRSVSSETGKTMAPLDLDSSSLLSHLEQAELIARAFKVTSLAVGHGAVPCRSEHMGSLPSVLPRSLGKVHRDWEAIHDFKHTSWYAQV